MIEVGQSELASFRQCPLLHKFRWRQGWHYPDSSRNPKSEIGTQWHIVQAAHYRRKMQVEAAGEVYTLQMARDTMALAILGLGAIYSWDLASPADEERQALLGWMAEGYLERWGTDEDWEIVAVEKRLSVPIADPDDPEAPPEFSLRFTADLVVRVRSLRRRLAIIDNKTIEGPGHWGAVDVNLHDQLGLYVRGYARLDPDDPPILAMLNQVRRDKLKRPMTLAERFSRPKSARTIPELDEIERDAISDLRRMHGEENLRRPTSHPDPKTCAWKCDFREAHIRLRQTGGDWNRALEIIHAQGMSDDPSTDPALTHR